MANNSLSRMIVFHFRPLGRRWANGPQKGFRMAVPISGQVTVTSAGTPVALGDQIINGPISVKALTDNEGLVGIGLNVNGTLTSSTWFPLAAGEERIMIVGNLANVLVDAVSNNDGVAWLKLNV